MLGEGLSCVLKAVQPLFKFSIRPALAVVPLFFVAMHQLFAFSMKPVRFFFQASNCKMLGCLQKVDGPLM